MTLKCKLKKKRCCVKKKVLQRRKVAKSRVDNSPRVRNMQGLVNIPIQVPIQIGSDASTTVGSADTNAGGGL
ncbi:MAG: hypothetical protein M0Z65_12935 [Firmicutes bacterium]|mgnify:CR=1 FL=1|uniref:Uncharacterized protein n=1 Tax=Melghirimyces thermohalophilus TaxID=1236220 RepID=A0A1G6RBL6_9BACL|nr:hypothetical protein [Melghirimyces thermohalophilus]MDA8354051.1 hypothetical protein [Bacillota bacterium]SDD02020.1 hypothetical protein SAMN04488112_12732 [Melghirimyces thermohalophilus]